MNNINIRSILPLITIIGAVPMETKRSVKITGERYRPIPKGCKVWEYEGIKILALNEKNAMRKAAKIKAWLEKNRPAPKEKPEPKATLQAKPKGNLKGSGTLK